MLKVIGLIGTLLCTGCFEESCPVSETMQIGWISSWSSCSPQATMLAQDSIGSAVALSSDESTDFCSATQSITKSAGDCELTIDASAYWQQEQAFWSGDYQLTVRCTGEDPCTATGTLL